MKPQFKLSHFQHSTFSDDEAKQTCFDYARVQLPSGVKNDPVGGAVAIRDSKNDGMFGTAADVTLHVTAAQFDAFLADARAVDSVEQFLTRLASGTLTKHCFVTGYDSQAVAFPYTVRLAAGPDLGVLRFSKVEMEVLYLGILAGEFTEDTVPAEDRALVLA